MPARDLGKLQEEIAKAKAPFGLPAEARLCTCYEAGRDGFWLHRALTKVGICTSSPQLDPLAQVKTLWYTARAQEGDQLLNT